MFSLKSVKMFVLRKSNGHKIYVPEIYVFILLVSLLFKNYQVFVELLNNICIPEFETLVSNF